MSWAASSDPYTWIPVLPRKEAMNPPQVRLSPRGNAVVALGDDVDLNGHGRWLEVWGDDGTWSLAVEAHTDDTVKDWPSYAAPAEKRE